MLLHQDPEILIPGPGDASATGRRANQTYGVGNRPFWLLTLLLQMAGGQFLPCQGGRSWQMRHRRWRVIRCLPALSEWPPKGLRLSGPQWPAARVRVAGAGARFGVGVWRTS